MSSCDCASCSCQTPCKCGNKVLDETALDASRERDSKTVGTNACKCGSNCQCADPCPCAQIEETSGKQTEETSSKDACKCGTNCTCNPCTC